MFDWLRAILEAAWDRLLPFTVVHQYQNTGVFRFGKYHRTLGPGLHWRWPFAEDLVTEDICIKTLALDFQTVTTKDNNAVVVCGIVRWRIVDVKPFICEIGNQHDVLRDTSMGAVLNAVRMVDLATLRDDPPGNKIAIEIRRLVKPYGINIEAFTFTDSGPIKTYRLMTHTHTPMDHLL